MVLLDTSYVFSKIRKQRSILCVLSESEILPTYSGINCLNLNSLICFILKYWIKLLFLLRYNKTNAKPSYLPINHVHRMFFTACSLTSAICQCLAYHKYHTVGARARYSIFSTLFATSRAESLPKYQQYQLTESWEHTHRHRSDQRSFVSELAEDGK